jgi:hypothetical protein
MISIDHMNNDERKVKDGSEQNFISCSFSDALGTKTGDLKTRENSSTTTYYEGSTF